jgi:hypothetical protein
MRTGRSRAVALLVAAAATVGATVTPLLAASPAAAATCGPAPDGRSAVVVVLDTGSQVVSRCVTVPTGSTGADALFAAVGPAQVRTGDGVAGKGPGFVCGLLGVPSSGCVSSSDQPSWVYWHADPGGSWRFAMSSFAGYRITSRCAVEGWRFGTGRAAPRVGAPDVRCDATTPAVPPPAAGGGATSPRVTVPAGGAPVNRPATTGQGPAPTVAGASTLPGAAATPTGSTTTGDPSTGDPSAAAGGSATGSAGAPAPAPAGQSPTASTPSTTRAPASVDGELASAADPTGSGSAGGPGTGLIVAATLVAALGAVAVVRRRTGRATVQDG